MNYKIHYDRIKKWAELNNNDNIYEITYWIKENEKKKKKMKQYAINIGGKLKKI